MDEAPSSRERTFEFRFRKPCPYCGFAVLFIILSIGVLIGTVFGSVIWG